MQPVDIEEMLTESLQVHMFDHMLYIDHIYKQVPLLV